mgnify:CR=1 FL=1
MVVTDESAAPAAAAVPAPGPLKGIPTHEPDPARPGSLRPRRPADIERETGSRLGSLYGISSNTRLAAFLRHRNRSLRPRGLYLCGGSVHPGGGMPLAVLSGKIAADLVRRHEPVQGSSKTSDAATAITSGRQAGYTTLPTWLPAAAIRISPFEEACAIPSRSTLPPQGPPRLIDTTGMPPSTAQYSARVSSSHEKWITSLSTRSGTSAAPGAAPITSPSVALTMMLAVAVPCPREPLFSGSRGSLRSA